MGLFGLMLLVTLSLASNSARLALADASGGFSYLAGDGISLTLKLIEGIFVPKPYEALVVYGIFLIKALLIPIYLPLI